MLFSLDAADFYKRIGQKILPNCNAAALAAIACVALSFAGCVMQRRASTKVTY